MNGNDLIDSLDGLEDKYILEVSELRMDNNAGKRIRRRKMALVLIAVAVFILAAGFVYVVKFIGRVKIQNGKIIRDENDYIYQITYDIKDLQIDSAEIKGEVNRDLENAPLEEYSGYGNGSSEVLYWKEYNKQFDTIEQLCDYIGYDELKIPNMERKADNINLFVSGTENGKLKGLSMSIMWHEYGVESVYISAVLDINMFTDNIDTQTEDFEYMVRNKDAVWTNTEYGEEYRVVNGREFLIIQSVRPVKEYYDHLPTPGYIEKRVFWVEDKVRYTFSVTGFFGKDEEGQCKEGVDKIVNEWMEAFQ